MFLSKLEIGIFTWCKEVFLFHRLWIGSYETPPENYVASSGMPGLLPFDYAFLPAVNRYLI
jgi:hypothetical protein